eukprot:jgi/Chrzof1/1352/Cz10g04050.t1
MADDPLANSGHFFGVTTLGATDPFFDNAAATLHYPFHEMPLEDYMRVFDQFKMGNSEEAAILRIDGKQHVLRGNLGDMLNTLLGRQARKTELQAWFTFCDFDRGCVMSLQEYQTAVELLREFSSNPQKARQYSSYKLWKSDYLKNRRVNWDPQKCFQEPLTASQEVGWHASKPHVATAEQRFVLNHTDVTKKEGRNAADYYGYMTLL